MNMGRVINIFILIFIILNLGLFYVNYKNTENAYDLSDERSAQLSRVLASNQMSYYGFLPKHYPRARLVVLEPENQEGALVEAMFGNEEHETDYSKAHVHTFGNEELTFSQGTEKGLIFYGASEPEYVPTKYDKVGKAQAVSTFVNDISLGNDQFELVDTRDSKDFDVYYFNERFEEELMFCNEVVVKLTDKLGITEARMVRFVPLMFEETTREIYPVDEVLYKFIYYIREMSEEPVGISSVDIGYDLGPDNAGGWRSQILDPYYKIKLASGTTYSINAYTNEIVEK